MSKKPETPKVKDVAINKYSIYEIKSAIDSKIIEVNNFRFIIKFLAFRK